MGLEHHEARLQVHRPVWILVKFSDLSKVKLPTVMGLSTRTEKVEHTVGPTLGHGHRSFSDPSRSLKPQKLETRDTTLEKLKRVAMLLMTSEVGRLLGGAEHMG